MKMLDEAAFYTRSGNIPAIFLIHFGHSYYIRSTCTFEVNSRHSSCILLEFLDARTVFGSHPISTLTAFVQHSRHFPTSVIRAAIELQSYGVQRAFWTLWQHSKYSYCVRTTFEMHSRANTLGMCRNHSMRVRSEFIVRYSNGILKNLFLMTFMPECGSNFENHSFRLVLLHSDSVWRGLKRGMHHVRRPTMTANFQECN